MFGNPSIFTRITIGKGIGFIFGMIGLLSLPYFLPDVGWHFRWGILLWYITFGALIGLAGVITTCPFSNISMSWWLRSMMAGAWLNFVLTFFAYDEMSAMMIALFGVGGVLSSPYWFVLEGVLIGLLIDYFATRFGGEGKETLTA